MDGLPTTPAAPADSRRQGAPRAAAESIQGSLGGRQVSDATRTLPGVSVAAGGFVGADHHYSSADHHYSSADNHYSSADNRDGRERTRIRSRVARVMRSSSGGVPRTVAAAGRPNAEPSADVAPGLDSAVESGRSELPWLTLEQFAECQAKRRRLVELTAPPQDPLARDDLVLATGIVDKIEDDIQRAQRLLAKSRTGPLSGVEWREIYFRLRSNKSDLPQLRGLLNEGLGRLLRNDAFAAADQRLVDSLQTRFDDAHDYLRSCGPPWRGATRRIETRLPLGTGTHVAVDGHFVPGRVLGAHLARGYPLNQSGIEICGDRYFRAPDLALTGLSNARGEMLYVGLSHGIFHAHEIDSEGLKRLSDDELTSVLFDYRMRILDKTHTESAPPLSSIWLQAEDDCARIRRSSREPGRTAHLLRCEAGRSALVDTIAIAILSEPEKFSRALNGLNVNVNLFSIALLGPGDVESWRTQHDCFCDVEPVRMQLGKCGEHANPRRIRAYVNVRQCALSVQPEPLGLDGCNAVGRAETERLLGPTEARPLGGDLKARVDAMHGGVTELRERVADLGDGHRRSVRELGSDHPTAQAVERDLFRLKDDLARLETDARTLEQAGSQLKAMWAPRGAWPIGADAQLKVAPRLALVGHLMGEMPVLSCVSGKDYTGRLEAEARFLATCADNAGGELPPLDLAGDAWATARKAFASTRQ